MPKNTRVMAIVLTDSNLLFFYQIELRQLKEIKDHFASLGAQLNFIRTLLNIFLVYR
jgi:hypothetical protein